MRAATTISWLAALAASGALAAAPSPDRYDPARLEAVAVERARSGDWGAARILIERAARLKPGDARIARHRDEIRSGRIPEALPPVPATPAPAASPKATELPPEPPAPWPPR